MDGILRGHGDWQAAVAGALAAAKRPILGAATFAPRGVAWDRAAFPTPRPAATLLLLYPAASGDGASSGGGAGELTIPLTLRHADLRTHAGEVALPGGAVDPTDASHEAAALREAAEEIGLDPAAVSVAGSLDDIWIPVSNFQLRPFVATIAARPQLTPQRAEVAAIFELPLRAILGPEAISEDEIEVRGALLRAAVYRHAELRIWGATARTLSMLATVLTDAGLAVPGL